jgi:flagellar motor switch protein FliM
MPEAKPQTVIRRKTEAGRPTQDSAPMTPARALGQALSRTAQEQMALPLRIEKVVEQRMTLADLPEVLEERALLALLDGPGEGIGLMALAPSLLAGLIEMQTMGRLASVAPPGRRPTRTDAAMTIRFIDAVLEGLEGMLAQMEAVTWAGGFRYASYLDDPRPLGLLLEDAGYRVFQAELVLGLGGLRTGRIVLALPALGRGPRPSPVPGQGEGEGVPQPGSALGAALWQEQMQRTVLQAPVALEAVLHRLTLPLAAVLTFKPGTLLPVPLAALEALSIEGLGGGGVAQGRLGQHQGMRAVRLRGEAEADTGAEAPPARQADPQPARRAAKPPPEPPAPKHRAAPAPVPREAPQQEPEPVAAIPMRLGSMF